MPQPRKPASNPHVRPQARQLALALVKRYQEEANPERYHEASWAILRQRYCNAYQYRFALSQAETARRLAAHQSKYLTTHGAAQYRAGQYPQAQATLAQADSLYRTLPASLALLPGSSRKSSSRCGKRSSFAKWFPQTSRSWP